MGKIRLKHHIEKQSEGRYYTLDFIVPEFVKTIKVSYSYLKASKKKAGNIVDLGIENSESQLVGWSGSDRLSVFVGEEESSPGYLCAKIDPGIWKIMIGAYKILETGCDVDYEIEFVEKTPDWYFGDLHVHTTASDGKYPLQKLTAYAKKRGMQFLALANHNNYAENLNLPIISDLTLIPAVEWTHYKGHVNFYGLTKPFEQNFTANSTSEAQKIMDYARQLGAIVSMNHPLDSNCPYLWDKEGFQFMEVWNGPMRPDNQKAIEWWKNQLEKGKHVIALGGSDFHRKGLVSLGNPVTGILSKSRSVLDLLEGIREGHVYIRSGIHGPVLALACQESTFGDSVKIGAGVDVKIIANSLHWYQALLIHTNKTIHRVRPTHGKIETILPIKEPGFLFLEVIMKIPFWTDHYTCAISNPIYFE